MSFAPTLVGAFDPGTFLDSYGVELLGVAIVLVGLLGFGLRDLLRFSFARVWTISGVCFQESIRRRVLWITPLAMLAVIAVSQLGRPIDQQDAIRQTIQYSVFTTGFVVVLATIILACTNLPKEMENRVIFTVVTKPATRLEIVLGKVLGFWRVALALLLLMGLFTFGYVEVRGAQLHHEVVGQLKTMTSTDSRWAALRHYDEAGLLQAKTYVDSAAFNIYSRIPDASDTVRWTLADEECNILIPFDMPESFLPPEAMGSASGAQPAAKQDAFTAQALTDGIKIIPLDIQVHADRHINYRWQKAGGEDEQGADRSPESVVGVSPMIHPEKEPMLPEQFSVPELTGQRAHARVTPNVTVDLSDQDGYTMIIPSEIYHSDFYLPFPRGGAVPTIPAFTVAKIEPFKDGPVKRVYVRLSGESTGAEIGVGADAVELECRGKVLHQARSGGKVVPAHFVGRPGAHGEQLRGGDPSEYLTPLADYSFNGDSTPAADDNGQVPFELRVGVERGGSISRSDLEDRTEVTVDIVNPANGKSAWKSQPMRVESGRVSYFSVPASAVSGKFDAILRCVTNAHHLGIHDDSLRLVTSIHPFGYNLFKSLLVMWLLSLLVVIVSVLCSTFLSWPIAVVLTIVILLGHWGVIELGDAAQPGIGHMVVQDLFRGAAPSTSQMVSSSVEGMTRMLNLLSKVLPDVSQFPSMQYVQDGLMMPWTAVVHSLVEALGFGIPLFVLGFFVFQRKEVAL